MKARSWIVGFLMLSTLGLLILAAGYIVIYMNGHTLLRENLEKLDMAETTVIYDRNGEEIAKLYTQNRKLATLDEVPDKLEEAIIATEDRRFAEHSGVDFWAIGRAIVKDILARDLVEGGSTITQQLAKNMFLTADKTFFRKATEMSIALALENNFEKDKILEMYLNHIYYGNGAYGVKAAAEVHFGVTDLDDLSLLEIAVLAGMPKAPETYSPTNNEQRALERAAVVLELMADQGYITDKERQEALSGKLRKPADRMSRKASAIRDYIVAEAARVTGLTEQELRIGGYKIYTTVDARAQRAVDQAFDNPELFPDDGKERIVQGAMVIIDPATGGIAAMSGGRNYVEKGLNRALAPRQPGSAFKPLAVFAPALETGEWHPESMLKDEKMRFGNYEPSNLSGKYAGEMTMREAVKRSINLPAVWLLNEIGVDRGISFLRKLGIELSSEDRNLAIALGGLTRGVSPLAMARAYGAFAAEGMLAETHVITKVTDSDGFKVYEHQVSAERVMSERTALQMTSLLESVTASGGTGTKANFGRPVAGKTGTTQLSLKGVSDKNGNRDIWFVGYTPEYAAAVWMGFDETDADHYVKSGSGTAAALFAKVMKEAMEGMPVRQFKRLKEPEPPKPEPPAPVASLEGTYDPAVREATLTWTPSETDDAAYRLYRKEAPDGEPIVLIETAGTTVIDISMLPGKTYLYYVTAVSPDGSLESEPSNVVSLDIFDEDAGEAPEEEPGETPDFPLPDIPLPDLPLPELPGGDDGDSNGDADEGQPQEDEIEPDADEPPPEDEGSGPPQDDDEDAGAPSDEAPDEEPQNETVVEGI